MDTVRKSIAAILLSVGLALTLSGCEWEQPTDYNPNNSRPDIQEH